MPLAALLKLGQVFLDVKRGQVEGLVTDVGLPIGIDWHASNAELVSAGWCFVRGEPLRLSQTRRECKVGRYGADSGSSRR
jgi:hypothetical protein